VTKTPIPTWYFALVVVRRGGSFLLVHERKHGQLWYLPAGRVEDGETLVQAAIRETLEEAGIPIRITGVLRIEHTPFESYSRVRAVFLGEPTDDTPPKSVADDESLEAAWVTLPELGSYSLRGDGIEELFEYVAAGGAIYPISILQREGMPYMAPGSAASQ
jgi:8-oxo-dGTP pyrophosphatase MutT (NUDIX family)